MPPGRELRSSYARRYWSFRDESFGDDESASSSSAAMKNPAMAAPISIFTPTYWTYRQVERFTTVV